jgi:hypothetical protein
MTGAAAMERRAGKEKLAQLRYAGKGSGKPRDEELQEER